MEAVKQIRQKGPTAAAHQVSRKATSSLLAVSEQKTAPVMPKPQRIQPKLKVNKPGDIFERQADAMADQVMRMGATEKAVMPMAAGNRGVQLASIQRKCAHCEEQEKKLQRKEAAGQHSTTTGGSSMSFVEKELSHTKGTGQPLPAHVNAFMSKSMGYDFSAVRIHTGGNAVAMNRSLHAHAFTHGKDIYFNSGMYDPESAGGKHLLAHELTHVVQQGYATPLVSGNMQASATGLQVQRWSMDDLNPLSENFNPLNIDIESLVQQYAPELVDIKRQGGLAPWLENKLAGAMEGVFTFLTAPIRSAADFAGTLSPTMAKIINWVKVAGVKASKNDCSSFTELATMLEQLADELAAPVIEKIKDLAGRASAWCKDLWNKFGVPVFDFIKGNLQAQWEMIQWIATTIWEKTRPIRQIANELWIKFKNWLGIGEGPEGTNGVLQWIEGKLTEYWNKIKAKVEPYRKQLMVVAGVMIMLSPAGPLIAAGAVFTVVFKALNWIRQNIHSPADIIKLRIKFEKEILPSLLNGLNQASTALRLIFGSLTGKLSAALNAFGKLVGMVADTVLVVIQSVLQWITDKLTQLVAWATEKLNELATWLQGIFEKIRAFVVPVIQFLEKVAVVVNDIHELPMLILGGLWNRVPACIRQPTEDFLINMVLKKIPFFEDVALIVDTWKKIKAGAIDIIKTVFKDGNLKGGVIKAFKLFLDIIGIDEELRNAIYEKAKKAYDEIVNRPKAIFISMVDAVKKGLLTFKDNFLHHFLTAAGNWIFSQVKGVRMPKEFTVKSIFGVVLDILGITEANIFDRIEKKKGKEFTDKLRKNYERLKSVIAWVVEILKDPRAAYEKAKAKVGEFANTVLSSIGSWIAGKVATWISTEVAAALATTPFGEVVEGIIYAYKLFKTARAYAAKVARTIETLLDSIMELAAHKIDKAAKKVEDGLVVGMEFTLAFLARVANLGDLPEEVKKIVEGEIRKTINSGIDWVIDLIIGAVQAVKGFAEDVKEAVTGLFDWNKTKVPFKTQSGEQHHVFVEKKGTVPVLMVASETKTVKQLMEDYRRKYKGNNEKLRVLSDIESSKQIIEFAANVITNMEKAKRKTEADVKLFESGIEERKQHIILNEISISLHLARILSDLEETNTDEEAILKAYAMEGRIGVHTLSFKREYQFEADHQPSNQMLRDAADLKGAPPFLRQIAKGRTALGYTIVLGKIRHTLGLTWGSKTSVSARADAFVRDIKENVMTIPDREGRLTKLESRFKEETKLDADYMVQLVSDQNPDAKHWEDIRKLDISAKSKQKLMQDVKTQINNGEDTIRKTSVVKNLPLEI